MNEEKSCFNEPILIQVEEVGETIELIYKQTSKNMV